MPGKRYNYRVTDGPFQGKRVRFVRSHDTLATTAICEIEGEWDPASSEPALINLPLQWLAPIPPPTTRRKEKP